MTISELLSETYARVETVCAGISLNNIRPLPDGPMILIPNVGDLSADGNVMIKLSPNGEITFIPRVPGQRIRVPMDLDDKVTGQEVFELTFCPTTGKFAKAWLLPAFVLWYHANSLRQFRKNNCSNSVKREGLWRKNITFHVLRFTPPKVLG